MFRLFRSKPAAGASPDGADALLRSAEIAARSGDLAGAIPLYTRAAELRPDDGFVHYWLGNALLGCSQLEAALASYDRAAKLPPGIAESFGNRGVVLERLGRCEDALESYALALALDPANALIHCNRAGLLQRLDRKTEALAAYEQAIAANPALAEAHFHRANLLKDSGRSDEALAAYDHAIAAHPRFAAAHGYRGVLLYERRDLDAALDSYERAIALEPGYAEAHYNRGVVHHRRSRFDAARADYERAIALVPHYAEAHMNLGALLFIMRRFDEALASFDAAIALDADYADAIMNRAMLLMEVKRWEEALAGLERLLELRPDIRAGLGMRTWVRMSMCDWNGFDANLARLEAGILADAASSAPLPVLAFLDRPDLQHPAARIWAREAFAVAQKLPPLTMPDAAPRIRVGYFSPDFREHVVALVTAELFEMHDRSKFEIIAFSFGPDVHDPMRARLKRAFDRFIDVGEMPDGEVVLLARRLGIDIAVDLAGYTQGCRPGIFALRAAPIQINYLGYPGTLGADCMDYLIADRMVIPETQRRHYSEKIIYLPHSYLPHDSTRMIAELELDREAAGLPPAGFVFCCFNSPYKITPDTFAGWMRILARTPGSVLWFSQSNPAAAANLRREATGRGIEATRLVFADPVGSPAEHLARQALGDLFLDTLPYNGHATTMDALWAGLPVLTRLGKAFPGRVAASLLTTIELPELITTTAEQYEDLAVQLAGNPERFAAIRAKLLANRRTSPLFATRAFARDLERAYAMIHARHRAGMPPQDSFVAPAPR